ncbi:MAG: hypothetical protein E6Q97_26645 [Desulfurellales bacterium]|nr:MAG: hypothetical protein E6Q97_26645 [Desulfurellales bacterium]
MSTRVVYPEFRDEHTLARYPFADDASLVADTGRVLTPDVVLDAMLYPAGNGGPLWLSRIEIDRLRITWVIANAAGDACSGTCDIADLDPTVDLLDALGRPAGILLLNPDVVAGLQVWDAGAHTFSEDSGAFVASCVAVAPAVGVRGIAAQDQQPLSGDIWIIGEDGVQFSIVPTGIRVDIVGDPLFRRRACAGNEVFVAPEFLRTINGIPPTYWGGFQLQAGRVLSPRPALRIYVDESGAVVIGLAAAEEQT